jgi:hypothetical protein
VGGAPPLAGRGGHAFARDDGCARDRAVRGGGAQQVQEKTARLAGLVRVLEARLAAAPPASPAPSAVLPPSSPTAAGPGSAEPVSGLLPAGLLGLLPGGEWPFGRGSGGGGALSPIPTARSAAGTATSPREPGAEDPAARPASRPASFFPAWGSPITFPGRPAAAAGELSESEGQPAVAVATPSADAASAGQCRQQ